MRNYTSQPVKISIGSSRVPQGPSAGSGDDQNDSSHNNAAEAAAESNRVIAAYNAMPSAARSAQYFVRVRSPHLGSTPFLLVDADPWT